jgi:hypothetical protein
VALFFFVLIADEDEDAAGFVAVRDAQEWNNYPASMDEADTSLSSQISAILRARLTLPRYLTDAL